MASHQSRLPPLPLQFVDDQRLHHKQRWLGVAGVVEVRRSLALDGFTTADGQEIAAHQLGGQSKALFGTRQAEHRVGHADFL